MKKKLKLNEHIISTLKLHLQPHWILDTKVLNKFAKGWLTRAQLKKKKKRSEFIQHINEFQKSDFIALMFMLIISIMP